MYYLWFDETQSGPYTLSQMREMWSAGKITTDTLYWQEGNAEWQPLGSILSEIAQSQPEPLLAHTTVMPTFEQVITRKTDKADLKQQPDPRQNQPEKNQWTGHPTLWKWAWFLAAGGVLLLLTIGLFFFYDQGLIIDLIPLLIAVALFAFVYVVRSSTRYTVTNKRVSLETGIFNTSSRELRIQDIRSIAANINVIGYGNIEFSSAAKDDAEVVFTAVPRAAHIRDLVKKLQT